MLSNNKQQQQQPYLGSCTMPKAWSWNMNEQGMLLYESKHSKKKHPKRLTGRTMSMSSTTKCVVRPNNQTLQTTFSMKLCLEVGEDRNSNDRRILFSLIRQRNIIHNEGTQPFNQTTATATTTTTNDTMSTTKIETFHIANTKDLAHSQASVPTIKMKQIIPTSHHNTNKRNHHHHHSNKNKNNNVRAALSPTLFQDDLNQRHTTTKTTSIKSSSNIKVRTMMQPHPYIAASTNGMYTDPQTGLAYHTDLCHYLGETKQKSGRHTLMGVGQYTKTMLKIKVRRTFPQDYSMPYPYLHSQKCDTTHRFMVSLCTFPSAMH